MEKSARDKKRETRTWKKIGSDNVRCIHRCLCLVIAGAVYDMEADRYVMDGGKSTKSLDREFYDTLCEISEAMSAVVAENRSAATL